MHTSRSAFARWTVVFDPVLFSVGFALQPGLGRLFLKEAFNLRGREFLVRTSGQTVQFQPPNADAGEPRDLVAEVVEHHANLTLESHFQHDVGAVVAVHPGAFCPGKSFLGHHPFHQFRHHIRIERLIDHHFVFFFSPLARMNDPVGKISAIGQENEAFAVFVEAADVVQILVPQRQQIVDRHAIFLVSTRAEVAFRLVQNENDRRLGAHRRAIDDHLVLRLHLRGQLGDHMAVDRHTSAEDDFLRATP